MLKDSNPNEGYDIMLLVTRFEEMLKNDNISFLDKTSLEKLIDYYEKNGPTSRAFHLVDIAIAQHPYTSTFFILKAQLLFDADMLDEAMDCLHQAEIFTPSEFEIHVLKADIFSVQKQYEAAKDSLDTALETANKDDLHDIYLAYSNLYEDQEDHKNAFPYLKKAISLNTNSASALEKLWIYAELLNNHQHCIDFCNQLLSVDAFSAWIWFNLGQLRSSTKDYLGAIDAYEFAFSINEKFYQAYKECGACLMFLDRHEEAVKCYKSAIENSSVTDEEFYLNLGRCYDELGNYGSARKAYYEIIRTNPENAQAMFLMGESYMSEELWIHALSPIEKSIDLEPNNTHFIATLADLYYQLDDLETANSQYLKAIEIDPEDVDIWINYLTFLIYTEHYQNVIDAVEVASDYIQHHEIEACEIAALYLSGSKQDALLKLRLLFENDPMIYEFFLSNFDEFKQSKEFWSILQEYVEFD